MIVGALLRHTCDVWRNQDVGPSRRAKALFSSDIRCVFIPVNAEKSIRNGWDLGKTYRVYFDETADVREGDSLKWDGGSFTVSSVSRYTDVGPVSHRAVLASREQH